MLKLMTPINLNGLNENILVIIPLPYMVDNNININTKPWTIINLRYILKTNLYSLGTNILKKYPAPKIKHRNNAIRPIISITNEYLTIFVFTLIPSNTSNTAINDPRRNTGK